MDLPSILLAAVYLGASCLTYICMTPPNHTPQGSDAQDRVAQAVTGRVQLFRRAFTVMLGPYHMILALTVRNLPAAVCPHHQNLNPILFSWSIYTSFFLSVICLIGAPLRIAAFKALGRNFTFQLAKPSSLNTNGVYRYIQHPSYTGQLLVMLGNAALFCRWDGAIGCWISEDQRNALDGWGGVVYVVLGAVLLAGVRVRVRDEERMLKKAFGEEWIRWNAKTKRFLPGVF